MLALGALLVAPTSASATASKVEIIRSAVFVGGTNLINDLAPHTITVSYSGGSYLVSDSAGVAPGTGCLPVSSTVASCTAPVGVVIDHVGVYASGGDDTITATALGPTVATTEMDGNGGDDTITTGPTIDEHRADEGDDILDGGLGRDILLGQAGIDTTTYASRTEGVIASIGNDDGLGEDAISTENVIGGSGNDTIIGARKSEPLDDEKSDPRGTYVGGPGNDRLSGGAGADRLDGLGGNDRLSGGDGGDKLKGGAGKDRCSGGKQKDRARQCERESSIP